MAPDSYTGQSPSGSVEGVGRLGRYQVIGRLATGGMAEVYLALSGELSGFRTLVVVKRILPHLASNHEFIRMFLDEARIAALLDHPNVVRIIEVGHDGDEYFLVMELVQGKPLSAIVRKAAKEGSPLTPALAAYIVAQAANGLGYAHNLVDADGRPLGVVHRDVSPQNILVSFEGAVKVIDFGIVRALGRVSQTNPGGLKGKIEYMSPEQASSEEVDRRADVFALGVVLWEALTGKHLFRRETELGTMRAIVDEPIPPASDVTPVAPELDAIVTRALAKKREDRFQSAQEMALALERYAFASEGFSPLQLASYLKQLFDVEFAQWKKTVSSALDLEVKPGFQSATSLPVIKPDLATRGATVALRPGSGSDSGVVRDLLTDARPSAPTRTDRLWVYGGLAATALMVIAGAIVLSRPRIVVVAAPPPAASAAPAAPTRWQPPAVAPSTFEPPQPPPTTTTTATAEPAPTPAAPPAEAPAKVPAAVEARPRADRAEKPRARARARHAQGASVPADHRPNPFD
ncbi:MAG TPA: serine/threonine-protein kinase [Polyangia bacterium]|nr:serine/threonine-protein kinase [Polyangia bacterium]